ncbi:hypothetical protein [Haloferula sargassicola]|uniref:Uncharacterized protein n=1 Tax=Haloferula sargassicola TaxID=490096 RepID=A0ABP9UX36_9BACT
MRPLPTTPESLTEPFSTAPGPALEIGSSVAAPNYRRSGPSDRTPYPWLLLASTTLAGVFCYLYLTKPIIAGSETTSENSAAPPASASVPATTTPAPADVSSSKPEAVAPSTLPTTDASPFEETVLRMQHVVFASGPEEEDLGRLTIEVPVAYESGTVHWSMNDVEHARSLLARIQSYQQKARGLREEAVSLITEWDNLIIKSIPESSLRADSPTLPENQGTGTADQAAFKTTNTIEIHDR